MTLTTTNKLYGKSQTRSSFFLEKPSQGRLRDHTLRLVVDANYQFIAGSFRQWEFYRAAEVEKRNNVYEAEKEIMIKGATKASEK